MNYEKKYKNALNWIELIYPTLQHEQRMEAEGVFPELKESEDERIRKELIAFLKENLETGGRADETWSISGLERWIAWLEKQGEKKEINYDEEIKKCKANPLYFFDKYVKVKLKEQSEQKPDKTRLKFEIGDWIVSARGTARIIGIGANDSDFLLEYTDGDQEFLSIEYVNSTYTKWNIQKAWEGDVLACGDDKRPFIFKGLLDQIHPNCPVAYCGIDSGHNFIASHDDSWWTSREVKPATKEQQDYLFKKMREAGYMWDSYTKSIFCSTNMKSK